MKSGLLKIYKEGKGRDIVIILVHVTWLGISKKGKGKRNILDPIKKSFKMTKYLMIKYDLFKLDLVGKEG